MNVDLKWCYITIVFYRFSINGVSSKVLKSKEDWDNLTPSHPYCLFWLWNAFIESCKDFVWIQTLISIQSMRNLRSLISILLMSYYCLWEETWILWSWWWINSGISLHSLFYMFLSPKVKFTLGVEMRILAAHSKRDRFCSWYIVVWLVENSW